MADTSVQVMVEGWVRREWLPHRYGQPFSRGRVDLSSGGVFEFDAVSADGTIIANISTSGLKTATGNYGSGKVQKVRSDIFFLLLAKAARKVVLLTEPDMYQTMALRSSAWPRARFDRVRARRGPGGARYAAEGLPAGGVPRSHAGLSMCTGMRSALRLRPFRRAQIG